MTTDIIIRAFRERPELMSSFEAVIAQQREKIISRLGAADTEKDLFRIQGELRGLTNLVSTFKTMLGNNHARANGHISGIRE